MRILCAVAVACAALAASARAGELELQAVKAAAAFSIPAGEFPRPSVQPQEPVIRPEGWMGDKVRDALRKNIFPLSPEGEVAVPAKPAAAELNLDGMLDRHWTTDISYPLGGRQTFIGGSFSRSQSGYLSVYPAGGAAPRFYEVANLVDNADTYAAGGVTYSVSVKVDIFNPKSSQLVFENQDDSSDSHSTNVMQLFDSAYATGKTVKLSNQTYQAFYAHEIKDGQGGPSLDQDHKTLGFMIRDGDAMKAYLVAAESLVLGKALVFTLKDGKKVALALSGAALKVFEL